MDWWEIVCFDCTKNDSVGKPLPLWRSVTCLACDRVPDGKQTVAERYNRGWISRTLQDLRMSRVNSLSPIPGPYHTQPCSALYTPFRWARSELKELQGLLFRALTLSSPEMRYFWSYKPCTSAELRIVQGYFPDEWLADFISRETWI